MAPGPASLLGKTAVCKVVSRPCLILGLHGTHSQPRGSDWKPSWLLAGCACVHLQSPESNSPYYLRVTLRSEHMLAAQNSKDSVREGKPALGSSGSICWMNVSLCGGHVPKTCPTSARVLPCACLLPLGCPQDRFGKGCELKCACRNGGLCHTTNGSCSCPLGWMGPHCEHGECKEHLDGYSHMDIEQGEPCSAPWEGCRVWGPERLCRGGESGST